MNEINSMVSGSMIGIMKSTLVIKQSSNTYLRSSQHQIRDRITKCEKAWGTGKSHYLVRSL